MQILPDKNSVIRATVKTAQELQQRDQTLIKQHQEYILQLARKDNDPVAICLYLQKHDINIRISTLRNFLLNH